MAKGSEILNKLLGGGLAVASIAFFTQTLGSFGSPEAFVPALLFGGAGVWLIARREKRAGPDLEAQQRLDQLAESLVATQNELAGMHEQLERLAEERDFMRQLASSARAAGLPAGSVVVNAPAAAALPQASSVPPAGPA
ncbi:MAG TPA: hypothetical protein VF832_17385 [Longimicrobiales bacterium]